jgi:hypothetical protein
MSPRRPLALPLPVLLALALLQPAPSKGNARQGRLRPPAFVTCDRNRLTSYTGRVVSLERGRGSTILRMETDENTREALVIRHPRGDVLPYFRMAGEPFAESDWQAIVPAGRLRPGTRATAWVCADEANPKIDWERPR